MTSWQFRCVCCSELRDAPMTRPEGTVYLRCIVSRQWAWYDASAFVPAAESVSALRLGDGGSRSTAPRAAAVRRTRGAARATRAPARSTRGAAGRKAARRARKRR